MTTGKNKGLATEQWVLKHAARAGRGGSGSSADVQTAAKLKKFMELFEELFEKVNLGTEEEPKWAIKAKMGLFSTDWVSAYGAASTTDNVKIENDLEVTGKVQCKSVTIGGNAITEVSKSGDYIYINIGGTRYKVSATTA